MCPREKLPPPTVLPLASTPHPAAKPEPQRLRMHRPHGAEAPVELEELAHHRRLVLADLQGAPVGIVAEGHQPAHPEAAPLGGGDLVADALGGHLALELREAQQHVQGQPAHAGRGVEGLGHRDEGGACRIQPFHELGEVGERTGQPVDLVDDDLIDLASLEIAHQPLQRRALQRPPRSPRSSSCSGSSTQPSALWLAMKAGTGSAPEHRAVEVLLGPFFGGLTGVLGKPGPAVG